MRSLSVLVAATALTSACVIGPLGPGDLSDGGTADTSLDLDASRTTQEPDTPTALWSLPRSTSVSPPAFSLPWPNDLARDAHGKVSFALFPHDGVHPLVSEYLHDFEGQLNGFSLSAAIYLRFGMPLDTSTLPTSPSATTMAASSVSLIDIDPASPEHGRRVPVQVFFRETPTRYWPKDTLAVAPVFGFPLRPSTRYALVVTRDVKGSSHTELSRSADLDAVLSPTRSTDPAVATAQALYAPALTELNTVGVTTEAILSLTVFTTDDPTAEFFRAADWLEHSGPRPTLADLGDPIAHENYTELRGHWGRHPNFQAGRNPYSTEGSGGFVLGPDGVPQVQRMETIRFALTLPTTPMPARGWPVVVYAHGTGGNYRTFINNNSAEALAAEGIAVVGFDQVFHGERAAPGTTPEAAFFNFTNPAAGRTNNRQAGLDLVQAGRFIRALSFELHPAQGEATTVHFDNDNVFFFGHSQGGLNGPLWLAASDGARAAVLSGAGGSIALALILKTEPIDIPALVSVALGLARDELVPLHPIVSLLQHLVDPSDPANYGRYILREPRAMNHPKHIFQTQGFIDHYAPPRGIAALAMSQGLPLALPVLHPDSDYDLSGLTVTLPARANVTTPLGAVTAVWEQFDAPPGRDGHFVVFDVPDARSRSAAFLGSAARDRDGVPTLSARPTGL